jgi:pimeloyl-ACP methyl ester carboxylesterase
METQMQQVRYADSNQTRGAAQLRCNPATEARTFSIAEYGALMKLRKITCETHFILPPQSGVIPRQVWQTIVRNNPASTCDILTRVGHLFPFEQHDLVLQTLAKYL